jgi:hypothetical protein
MSPKYRPRYIALILIGLFLPACALLPAAQSTPVIVTVLVPVSPQPPQAQDTPLLPADTQIPSPQPTDLPMANPPTPTNGPTCSVVQNLNLRNGPGTDYDPPVAALEKGTSLVPVGFNPQGIPSGPWVQVQVADQNRIGWVSAGTQFVECNLDLNSLPQVDVPPPPKPVPPRIGTGDVDGNNISSFRFSENYDPAYFIRMYVFRSDNPDEAFDPKKDGRGIDSVEFIVTSRDQKQTFYQHTEGTAGYCIFGGGEPDCNPWVREGGQYKWAAGGDPVQPGAYTLDINVSGKDGVTGSWLIDVNIELP